MDLKDEILKELDRLIAEGKRLDDSYLSGAGGYHSQVPEAEFRAFTTSALAAISRTSGRDSDYYTSTPKPKPDSKISSVGIYGTTVIAGLRGALIALRNAVDSGLLESLESRLRANVHDDFLEQAQTLLSSGYHVAAMVLIGGVIEDHLRKLCTSRSLTWKRNGSLSKYNDLLRDVVYPQPVWRRIQAIADVRNDAAHGDGAKVKLEDVEDTFKYAGRLLSDHPS